MTQNSGIFGYNPATAACHSGDKWLRNLEVLPSLRLCFLLKEFLMAVRRKGKHRSVNITPAARDQSYKSQKRGNDPQPSSLPILFNKWSSLLISLFLIGACFQAFGPLLEPDCEFISLDDGEYVFRNQHIIDGVTAE